MQDITTALLSERDWLASFAQRLVRDAAAADDLVQETWLKALQHPPARLDRPRGWLATVMRSVLVQTGRADSRRERRERLSAAGEALDDVTVALQRSELEQQVAQAVAELPQDQREAIVLRFREGWSSVRIARELELTDSAVRSRVHRGLEQVRAKLRRSHPEDERAWALALIPLARRAMGTRSLLAGPTLGVALVAAAVLAFVALSAPRGLEPASGGGARPDRLAQAGAPGLASVQADSPTSRTQWLAGPGRMEVRGRLVDDGGQPLAERSLTLYCGRESRHELVTDAAGIFAVVLERPDGAASVDLDLQITDPLLEPWIERWTRDVAECIDLGSLRRPRRGAVRFTFTNGAGHRPARVQGALVQPGRTNVSSPLARPASPPIEWELEAGQGLCRGVEAGSYVLWVRGDADRWTSRELEVELDRITDLGPIVGEAAASAELLTVALIAPDGAPFTRSAVRFTAVAEGWFASQTPRPDAQGQVRLLVDGPGPIDLVASSYSREFASLRVEVRPETPRPIRMQLQPWRALEVEVRDAIGRPVRDAMVSLRPATSERTDWLAGGRYIAQESYQEAWPTSIPGTYAASPLARPFSVAVATRQDPSSSFWSTVAVQAVDDPSQLGSRLVFELPFEVAADFEIEDGPGDEPAAARQPAELGGRVLRPDGSASVDVTVALVDAGAVVDAVNTDVEGRFWLAGDVGPGASLVTLPHRVRPGFERTAEVAITAEDPRFRHALPPADSRGSVELMLPARARLTGRLLGDPSQVERWSLRIDSSLEGGVLADLDVRAELELPLEQDGHFEAAFVPLDETRLLLRRAAEDEADEPLELELQSGEYRDLALDLNLTDRSLRSEAGLDENERLAWVALSANGLRRSGEVRGPLAPGATVLLRDLPGRRMVVARKRQLGEHGWSFLSTTEVELDDQELVQVP
ncbi:RNA polymerase sigma factor [Engelhardtia mirabilis]|uniref:ECF RNA polymerase sigma factor SigL n=1 Tax=Engelhardtia mirabilis TaxID=2528011 RepID=A0A518BLT1_9BACT|nr:ECF RNA polymerase sigma factor SigL [Planctomycetes bacterium Pla133]QDV02256.1 ECF RNA polymerase sigma factor SigL [Planctomycetes bacterium Pla86]